MMNGKKAVTLSVCLTAFTVFAQNSVMGSGTGAVPETATPYIPRQAWSIGLDQVPDVVARPEKPGLRDCGPYQGAPLGGFGTGGIGRNYRGSFGRWTIKSGAMKEFCLPANMFSVRVQFDGEKPCAMALHPGYPRLRPDRRGKSGGLDSWNWDYSGKGATYRALYPKSWYHYPANEELPVELSCEQFSPVLPGQYRETSLPVGVFNWTVTNPNDRPVEVSLMFSFANMVGWFNDFDTGQPLQKNSGNCNRIVNTGDCSGIVMERENNGLPLREGDGQICIATSPSADRKITMRSTFPANKDGEEIWQDFVDDGNLTDTPGYRAIPGDELAGALCVKVRIAPKGTVSVPMALSWDLPLICFGNGREHWRQYTRYFDRSGRNAIAIADEALYQFPEWSRAVDRWHRSVIRQNPGMSDSFFSLLFNESYLSVEGLTVWTDGTRDNPGKNPFFGVIECPDYAYYCTFDLWTYGSFLFLYYWPELEKNVIRNYAAGVFREDHYLQRCLASGLLYPANVAGAVPHDLGSPNADPPFTINNYTYQNPNKWKDLNCQFVLTLYRDVTFLNDDQLLHETWPAVKAALQYLRKFDTDHDGLIENDGTPDQTMDNIPMKGPSSYCSGLWLGAVNAAVKMAERTGDIDFVKEWQPIASAAGKSFEEKLWTGTNYRLDTEGDSPDALFIDELFGIWYARMCGLTDLVPEEHYRAHLAKVYERNFAVRPNRVGAVNISGWKSPSSDDGEDNNFATRDSQRTEVLYGLNLSFTGQLLDAGLKAQADTLIDTLYSTVYGKFGLWFQSPAALTEDGRFRAIINFRPLIIWALAKSPDPAGIPPTGENFPKIRN
ncbi:MAG: GH116 family glycosyl hydrolase [Kiritimatiellales bacterium]